MGAMVVPEKPHHLLDSKKLLSEPMPAPTVRTDVSTCTAELPLESPSDFPDSLDLGGVEGEGEREGEGEGEDLHVLNLPFEDISKRYHFGAYLGEGTSGTVRMCADVRTGEWLACKTVRKENADVADLRREICAMGLVGGHPAIVTLRNVMEDRESVHLITELATGGDLFSRISEMGNYSEKSSAQVCRILGSALRRCHSRGVVHRDLKPENVLLVGGRGKGSEAAVKLADFGHCAIINREGEGDGVRVGGERGRKMSRCVGTPYYVAPEVLEGSYGAEADIWSLGVILYVLLSGEPPFWAEDTAAILKAVQFSLLEFTDPVWESVSLSAKDLVSRMLTRDVSKRITLAQMKEHPWIVKHCGFSRTRLPSKKASLSQKSEKR